MLGSGFLLKQGSGGTIVLSGVISGGTPSSSILNLTSNQTGSTNYVLLSGFNTFGGTVDIGSANGASSLQINSNAALGNAANVVYFTQTAAPLDFNYNAGANYHAADPDSGVNCYHRVGDWRRGQLRHVD